MQNELNARTAISVWVFIGFSVLLFAYSILNDRVFHPREPIGFRDVDVLKQELNQIIDSTSSVGTWGNRLVIEKSFSFVLTVSAIYYSHQSDERTMTILIGSLQQHGWKPLKPDKGSRVISTFCKSRYRADIQPFDEKKGAFHLSFGLKRYKDDLDCV